MIRSLVNIFRNSLLRFLFFLIFGKGILKILSALLLLDAGHPNSEQFFPGIA